MSETGLRIREILQRAGSVIERVDAEWLLAHVLEQSPGWLWTHADDPLTDDVQARFEALVARRAGGEPVAYLTGTRGFWTLDLAVTPATLIPRVETERLLELALDRLPVDAPSRVVDLGTGSGAIALAIARERPLAAVIATDTSKAALAVAVANAQRNAIGNVWFRRGDWCAALAGERFDLIASNPPYIAAGDPHLAQGDLRFEPAAALASGDDGLDAIRSIVRDAPAHLVPAGWLLLEHGWDQGGTVRALMAAAGFVEVATESDLEGRDRVTLGRRP